MVLEGAYREVGWEGSQGARDAGEEVTSGGHKTAEEAPNEVEEVEGPSCLGAGDGCSQRHHVSL